MKTIVVTGGCGFIGSHFVRLLIERTSWRVVNLDALTYAGDPDRLDGVADHPRHRLLVGDVADARLVDSLFGEEGPSAIVNFAAESHVDRSIVDASPFMKANVVGVQTLLECARRHGVSRFVQVSTDEVYGDFENGGRASEGSLLRPSSPYAASKASADLLCLAYQRTYGVSVLIVRSSNNYGPWQHPEKLLPLMFRHAVCGRALPIYGDGGQQRDWLYVEDNCDAIFRVLVHGKTGAIYNVGTGEERTNLEVVRIMLRVLAEECSLSLSTLRPRVQFVLDRPGHDRRYAMDSGKIRRELGWWPQVSYEDGLRRTLRSYLAHREWLDRPASVNYADYYQEAAARLSVRPA